MKRASPPLSTAGNLDNFQSHGQQAPALTPSVYTVSPRPPGTAESQYIIKAWATYLLLCDRQSRAAADNERPTPFFCTAPTRTGTAEHDSHPLPPRPPHRVRPPSRLPTTRLPPLRVIATSCLTKLTDPLCTTAIKELTERRI